jgi:glycosidase
LLTIRHYVTSPRYRSPSGPVPCGSLVTFRAALGDDSAQIDSVRLFYAHGLREFHQSYQRMEEESCQDDSAWFKCQVQMDEEPGLFFYWFEVRLRDGRYRWGFPDQASQGTRAETLDGSPSFSLDGSSPIPGFQLTVHAGDFVTPDWMKGAVIYQIFPDRFSRGSRFDRARAQELMQRPERIWHSDWREEVDFKGKAPQGYQACDFFGGTLEGIVEQLPYLASMGVTVLYLNPVFEAQSNHRYDTGDYLTVDPLLGTNDDLIRLFKEAGGLGIQVILDGVFSHTGADSLYFNRYGRYPSAGAWQEMRDGIPSDFTSWYRFAGDSEIKRYREEGDCESATGEEPLLYECWWDFHCLPNVNEEDLSYRRFICGPDGVLAYWIRRGCAGFRLDVSDELPDSFLRLLRKRIKQERPDAFILGEVWEEPTAKISYGHHRDFLFGNTHDAVMGYTFRRQVLAFLQNKIKAEQVADAFENTLAVTPKEALYTQMNLLGSHDTSRIITELAGRPMPAGREEQARLSLTGEERKRGERMLILASLFQIAFPGAMAVYYGDELGMEGYDDPFNRRTYPWEAKGGPPESRLREQLASIMRLKSRTPVLKTGLFEIVSAREGAILLRRYKDGGLDAFGKPIAGPSQAWIAINRADGTAAFPAQTGIGPLGPESGAVYLDGERVFSF